MWSVLPISRQEHPREETEPKPEPEQAAATAAAAGACDRGSQRGWPRAGRCGGPGGTGMRRAAWRCACCCHFCLSALLQQVAAVKRTMPMIGMDEEDEEHESPGDDDDDDHLAPSPAQALQQRQKQTVSLRSPVGAFLSGQAQPKNGSRQGSLNPVQREIARQMAYDGSSDVSGLDDSAVAKDAMYAERARGSVGRGGVMSYHGGKVITGSLQVYLIMCAGRPSPLAILHGHSVHACGRAPSFCMAPCSGQHACAAAEQLSSALQISNPERTCLGSLLISLHLHQVWRLGRRTRRWPASWPTS